MRFFPLRSWLWWGWLLALWGCVDIPSDELVVGDGVVDTATADARTLEDAAVDGVVVDRDGRASLDGAAADAGAAGLRAQRALPCVTNTRS